MDSLKNEKQAQVVEALNYLIDRINTTTEQLSDLEKRLTPIVLTSPESECLKQDTARPNRCPLAQQIFDYADKVNVLNQKIASLLRTLEI